MSSAFKQPGFFLGSGQPISKDEFYARIKESTAPVVMVGENHEDALAQALELNILKTVSSDLSRKVGLSLEFYDRESQTVLDEYLADIIPLKTFLADSRPPGNHAAYQPLIDHCKAGHMPVIATNIAIPRS